jgi:hypothetical protein
MILLCWTTDLVLITCRYFTPIELPGAGMLQDGGVQVNCPLRTALRESEII